MVIYKTMNEIMKTIRKKNKQISKSMTSQLPSQQIDQPAGQPASSQGASLLAAKKNKPRIEKNVFIKAAGRTMGHVSDPETLDMDSGGHFWQTSPNPPQESSTDINFAGFRFRNGRYG